MENLNIIFKVHIFLLILPVLGIAQNQVVHQNHDIIWLLHLNKIEGDSSHYTLRSEFKSKNEPQILCIESMNETFPVSIELYKYDSSIVNRVHVLDFYLNKLKFSQFLIENNEGFVETFSFNTKMPKTGNSVIFNQYSNSPHLDIFNLYQGKTVIIEEEVTLEQLKLSKGEEKVRIHYLNKKCNNKTPFIITSSWIELPASDTR